MTADDREVRFVSEAFDLEALLKRHPLPWRMRTNDEAAWVIDGTGREIAGPSPQIAEALARLMAAAPGMVKAIRDHLEWGPKTGSDRSLCDEALKASLP